MGGEGRDGRFGQMSDQRDLVGAAGEPEELGFAPARLRRIDDHFAKYVDDGRLAGWQVAVSRGGKVVHASTCGHRDTAAGRPFQHDTIVRLYSMTKAITSVAAMMLYEEGAFELKDPVAKFIPSFADMRVFSGGSSAKPTTEPAREPMRIWHLLTHTSGLTYGFHYSHPVDALYRAAGFDFGMPPGVDLADVCERWSTLPLLFEPGSRWNYSVATDVLGRIVEIVSGMSLDEFFRTRIFEPLGMTDTAFHVDEGKVDRFAVLYSPHPKTGKAFVSPLDKPLTTPPAALSGGGGLTGTTKDYLRFVHMLRGRGEFEGVRLLGTRTVDYMTRNHLPGGQDLEQFGIQQFAETTYEGVGFGLGFSVVDDPVKNRVLGSTGDFGWGGAASTTFWVDPVNDIAVVFLTQLLPSSTHPIRSELKRLVLQALID